MNPLNLLQGQVIRLKEYSELGNLGGGRDGRVKEMGRYTFVYLEWRYVRDWLALSTQHTLGVIKGKESERRDV